MKKVLYVGSGRSSLVVKEIDLSEYIIVCVNNSWRLFENKSFDVWIHSGDFPKYAYSPKEIYNKEISFNQYKKTAEIASKQLNWKTSSPQHYVGYTIFFSGLYWIMMELKPKFIGLLGFDHDYNENKVKKWNEFDKPNIQNKFNLNRDEYSKANIYDWANDFFKDMDSDFFYGHGIPDPLRSGLGYEYLLDKFKLAKESSEKLGIDIINYSDLPSKVNIFKRGKINGK